MRRDLAVFSLCLPEDQMNTSMRLAAALPPFRHNQRVYSRRDVHKIIGTITGFYRSGAMEWIAVVSCEIEPEIFGMSYVSISDLRLCEAEIRNSLRLVKGGKQ